MQKHASLRRRLTKRIQRQLLHQLWQPQLTQLLGPRIPRQRLLRQVRRQLRRFLMLQRAAQRLGGRLGCLFLYRTVLRLPAIGLFARRRLLLLRRGDLLLAPLAYAGQTLQR